MKTLPGALAAHIATRDTTLATALKITRADAAVHAFTSHDRDAVISGTTYSAAQGLDASTIVTAAGMAVGNLEIRTLHDGTLFTTRDILGGIWRNAAFECFRYNWASLGDGTEPLLSGHFGEVRISSNLVVVELRDLRQYLQQNVGSLSSKTCRDRLGGPKCRVALGPFTHNGTLTAVTNNQVFRDSTRSEPADYFGEGSIRFTSGQNAGLSAKVRAYAANGTFTVALPFYATVAIGDAYTAIAGCRKRLEEDCRDKFANVVNFYGEPHRRGLNNLTGSP